MVPRRRLRPLPPPLLLAIVLSAAASAFAPVVPTSSRRRVCHRSPRSSAVPLFLSTSASDAARQLLYQDQQKAKLDRAQREAELLSTSKGGGRKELKDPKLRAGPAKSGTGFGGGGGGGGGKKKKGGGGSEDEKRKRLAEKQADRVKRDGVLRVDGALSSSTTDALREHILRQRDLAWDEIEANPAMARTYLGVEGGRKNRCDLHLSLLRGGIAAASGEGTDDETQHPLADALKELLGEGGTLRPLYEELVTPEGEFYELAAVVTDPGSDRQMIHPDLPFQSEAPLYVIFLALQDVTEEMGPTTFLVKTHTEKACEMFSGGTESKDEQLVNADCRLATLKKGDAVLFDARVLHCGGGNDAETGNTRAMLNFSFRNPKVKGDIGYKGSMMPGYVGAMTLSDVGEALRSYSGGGSEEDAGGESDPFARYGNGLAPPSSKQKFNV